MKCIPLIALLLFAAPLLTGCEGIAYVAQGVVPPMKDALYELPQRPTLVLVDDPLGPEGGLGDPQLAFDVAVSASTDLVGNDAVDVVIDQKMVADLAVELGVDYYKLGVVNVGRRVGAAQVIHVQIKAVNYVMEPLLFRPTALVHVRVLDCDPKAERTVMFPPPPPDGTGIYPLTVEMRYRVSEDGTGRDAALLRKALADRIGIDVAKMFYKHVLSQPGDMRHDR